MEALTKTQHAATKTLDIIMHHHEVRQGEYWNQICQSIRQTSVGTSFLVVYYTMEGFEFYLFWPMF